MIRTALLTAAVAIAFSFSPALASGPTVLTDAELDSVVGGATRIVPNRGNRRSGESHGRTVPADLVRIFDNNPKFACDIDLFDQTRCRPNIHGPGNAQSGFTVSFRLPR